MRCQSYCPVSGGGVGRTPTRVSMLPRPDFPGLDYYIIQGYFAYCPSFSIQVISLHYKQGIFEHFDRRDPRTGSLGVRIDSTKLVQFSYSAEKFSGCSPQMMLAMIATQL